MLNPRTALAVAFGALLTLVLRMRGSVPADPEPGGWRDLDDTALSADRSRRGGGPP